MGDRPGVSKERRRAGRPTLIAMSVVPGSPRGRAALAFALAVALVVALVAGCSSGVEPRRWSRSVCAALTPWRTQISSLTSQAKEQITGGSTPRQAKESLVVLLGGVEAASEDARRAVAEAGTPDVPNGDQVASRFVASLTVARDAYAHARTAVAALPTSDATAFYDGVTAAFDQLNSEYAASALDTASLGSAELEAAFAEEPTCR